LYASINIILAIRSGNLGRTGCDRAWGKEKHLRDFGRETWGKEVAWKTKTYMGRWVRDLKTYDERE